MLFNNDLRAQNTFDEAKSFAAGTNNPFAIHLNKCIEVRFFIETGKYSEALALFDEIKSEAIKLKSSEGYKKAYRSMSRYYYQINRDEQKYIAFLNAELVTSSALKDENARAKVLKDFGMMHYLAGRITEAGKYFEIAADLFRKTGNKQEEAGSLMNTGICYFQNGDFYKSLPYYAKSEKVFFELNDSLNVAKVYENYALSYSKTNEKSKTEQYYQKALLIYKKQKDTSLIGGTYDNMASYYEKIGEKDKAIKLYFVGLNLREAAKDSLGIVTSLINISGIYSDMKNHKECIVTLDKAMMIAKKCNNKKLQATVYSMYGNIYFSKGEYEKALGFHQNAKAVYTALKSQSRLNGVELSLGNVYLKLKRFKDAINSYQIYLNAVKQINDSLNMAGAYSNIGVCYYDMRDFKKAMEYYKMAYEIRKKSITPTHLMDTYITFGNVYYELKDYKNAYYFNYKASKMKDSLTADDFGKQLSEMQAKYDNVSQEAQIKMLEKDKKLADEDIRRRKTQRNILLGGISILLLLLGLIFYGYKEKKKSNKQLADQKVIIEEKQKEILDSIHYAKRIQNAMLSGDFNWTDISPEHFILFKPRDIVSGDFYWSYYDKPFAVWCVADCTGHGVPGAFMSMIGVAYLSQIIAEGRELDPGKVLDKLREKIIRAMEQKGVNVQQRDGMDISLCIWDKNKNQLLYAGANNAIYILRNKELTELKPDKMPIGAYTEELKPFTTQVFNLQKGDRIINFSDGYADQFGGEKGKKFMYKNMKNLLIESSQLPIAEQKTVLEEKFNAWKQNYDQVDDVCLIGVEVV